MRRSPILVALLAAATLLPATPALAGPAPVPTSTFAATIGACSANGSAVGLPSTSLIVEHRRANGTLVKKHTLQVDGFGDWSWACPGPLIARGDRIRFRLPGQSTPFRIFTVPKLQLTTDRVADEVRGRVPGPLTSANLARYTCDPSHVSCLTDDFWNLEPETDGTFTVSNPVSGSQFFVLTWRHDDDKITMFRPTGWIEVRPGSARVGGLGGAPGTKVTFTLRRGAMTVRATATVSTTYGSLATLRSNGKLVKVKVGDRITSTVGTGARLIVPIWNAYASEAAVNGRCFPGGVAQYRRYTASGTVQNMQIVDADGEFGTWGAPDTVTLGDRIDWWCQDADGDVLAGSYTADW